MINRLWRFGYLKNIVTEFPLIVNIEISIKLSIITFCIFLLFVTNFPSEFILNKFSYMLDNISFEHLKLQHLSKTVNKFNISYFLINLIEFFLLFKYKSRGLFYMENSLVEKHSYRVFPDYTYRNLNLAIDNKFLICNKCPPYIVNMFLVNRIHQLPLYLDIILNFR